jgi:hypothetical protein
MPAIRSGLAALGVAASLAGAAEAEVVKFEVLKVEPVFDGQAFGDVGPYEKISARATMAVDPLDKHNTAIFDIGLAPRNATGRVEFSSEVMILKPVDLARGNGRLFLDVLNRGSKIGLVLMNDAPLTNDPATAVDAGNGYLMHRGYTLVWSSWQFDVPAGYDRMLFDAPVVPSLTGLSREEFVFDHLTSPVRVDVTYPPAEPARATLSVRARETDARQTPPDMSFRFVAPTQIEIVRPSGFDAGALYELVYLASDPAVAGLGFSATRDIVSFLRRESRDRLGNANPLAPAGAPAMKSALALGISQSGRYLRDLVYQGFNEDETGRIVFDGVMVHIAGSRRTYTNYRFAQPGRYSREHEDHSFPGDQFPFSYATTTDPLTGRSDGLLERCTSTGTCPKIIHTDSDAEAWQARSSLVVTDTSGRDLTLPSNVRAFLLSGMPHFSAPNVQPGATPICIALSNPLHAGPAMRALLAALDAWVSDGTAPPASRYPSRTAGTLVEPETAVAAFPKIPGFTVGPYNRLQVADHAVVPPRLGAEYPVFLPKPDTDGHALGALRLPAVQVPIATYVGINRRKEGFAPGALCGLAGATLPFAAARAEREVSGDPRLSLAERYPTPDSYVEAVTRAAAVLVADRLMLPEDAERLIARATSRVAAN